MTNKRLLIPVLIVLITNSIVLAGISYNKSGTPVSDLILTERELSLATSNKEDSGLHLRLEWGFPEYQEYNSHKISENLLNAEKLESLDFPCRFLNGSPEYDLCFRRYLPIKVFLVLEYGGEPFQKWRVNNLKAIQEQKSKIEAETDSNQLKHLKRQLGNMERAPLIKSRLFAIDLGGDTGILRQKYSDPSRYIITPALLRASVHKKSRNQGYEIRGWIQKILINDIHVEPRWQEFFEKLPRKTYNRYSPGNTPISEIKNRYQVRIKYGKRHEPWIEDIGPYQKPESNDE